MGLRSERNGGPVAQGWGAGGPRAGVRERHEPTHL